MKLLDPPAVSRAGVRNLAGQRIFVSGGAGVIGRELVPMLIDAGAEVLVGDLEPRPPDFPKKVAYRRGDLNRITERELRAFSPEVFFHLAATFERSVETPGFFDEGHRHNIALSHHLIGCMAKLSSLGRVVFASSYLIYDPALYTTDRPQAEAAVLDETATIRPRNLCGSAKHHHELELEFLSECPDVAFTSVSARIFRSYGCGSRDVISRWVRSLLAKEVLEVYGVEGSFDYIFARDVARGLLALAMSEAKGVVNLATGSSRRVSEVLAILLDHFPSMETRSLPTDIAYETAAADVTRLLDETGWSPQTRIEEGIAEIIAYEHKQAATYATRTPQIRWQSRSSRTPRGQNVLITSIAKKIPLIRSVRRALAKFDPGALVYGADCDADALGVHFVDAFWQCPRLDELSFQGLLEYCLRHGISFVVPTRDAELPVFAEYRPALAEAGIEVLVGSPSSVANCVDKLRFAKLLEVSRLPAIPTTEDFDSVRDHPSLVVKERFGGGSKNLHCNVSPEEALGLSKHLESPIFQPFLQGREFSVDLYRDRKGCVHGVVCRTRDSVVGGESQITTLVESPVLADLCEQVVRALAFWGHATLQAIELPSGEFRMLECNARFGGASTLSDEAGLESFYWFLLEASGENLNSHPFARSRAGLRLIRHASDHFVN